YTPICFPVLHLLISCRERRSIFVSASNLRHASCTLYNNFTTRAPSGLSTINPYAPDPRVLYPVRSGTVGFGLRFGIITVLLLERSFPSLRRQNKIQVFLRDLLR